MPTVTAALEYLLDVIAEHQANIENLFFADRATPPGQFGEMVENILYLNRDSYYVPSLTPSATSEAAPSVSEEEPGSSETESSETTSVDETPPPSYSRLPVVDRLPTPFASPTGRGPPARPRRRPASEMDDDDEDDTPQISTLRRSTRLRRNND
jgi:hypothetical protein